MGVTDEMKILGAATPKEAAEILECINSEEEKNIVDNKE